MIYSDFYLDFITSINIVSSGVSTGNSTYVNPLINKLKLHLHCFHWSKLVYDVVQSQFFPQFLLFLQPAEKDNRSGLSWPMEALQYENISFNSSNGLSQLAMETAMVSMIWIVMRRLGKSLSSPYWTINSRSSLGLDIFRLIETLCNPKFLRIAAIHQSCTIRPNFRTSPLGRYCRRQRRNTVPRHREGTETWRQCRANERTFHPFLCKDGRLFPSWRSMRMKSQKIITQHAAVQLHCVTSCFTCLVFILYRVLENLKYLLKALIGGFRCFCPCTPPGFGLWLNPHWHNIFEFRWFPKM